MSTPDLHDPFCLPLHVRPNGLELVQLDGRAFRDEPFHDHRLQERYPNAGLVPFAQVLGHARAASLPAPHYVFHHAFSLSTLLSRWFDEPGTTLGYREPLVLTELSQLDLAQPGLLEREDGQAVLGAVVALLQRVERAGERALIKGCDSLTNIVPGLLAQHPRSHGVLLYTDLDTFVLSCLKARSRTVWARDRAAAFARWPGSQPAERVALDALDDAEAVAYLWGLQLSAYARLLAVLPDRLRAVYAEALLRSPIETFAEVAEFFALPALPPERIAARVSQPHAKTGERYDAAQRAGELAAHARQLSGELARARAFFDRTFGEVALGDVRITSAPHA